VNLLKETAEIETGMPEKSSWDQANRQQKHGLVWRNRKKISQIIKDYFYLPFFLQIILWVGGGGVGRQIVVVSWVDKQETGKYFDILTLAPIFKNILS
jgi:hypothetical protein